MKTFWNKLKENDYVITISSSKAAMSFSAFMMFTTLLFYFVLTPRWVSGRSQFGPSPQMVPNLLTIAMFVCAFVIFMTEFYTLYKRNKTSRSMGNNNPAQSSEDAKDKDKEDYFEQLLDAAKIDVVTIDLRGFLYILAAVAACVFYVLFAGYLGFILTIAIIMIFLLLLYGVRKPLTILITSAMMSVGVYFAFTKLLSLVLPAGTLF